MKRVVIIKIRGGATGMTGILHHVRESLKKRETRYYGVRGETDLVRVRNICKADEKRALILFIRYKKDSWGTDADITDLFFGSIEKVTKVGNNLNLHYLICSHMDETYSSEDLNRIVEKNGIGLDRDFKRKEYICVKESEALYDDLYERMNRDTYRG